MSIGAQMYVHGVISNLNSRNTKGRKKRLRFPTYFFFEPLWLFSVFSVDLSLEWLESLESTDSLDLSRLRSLSLCFLRRSISRRRSTGSSLYFPSPYKCREEEEFNTKVYSALVQHHYFAIDCTDFWRTGVYLSTNQCSILKCKIMHY